MYYGGPFDHAGNKKVSDMTGYDLTQAYENMRACARADAREAERQREQEIERARAEARRHEWERQRMDEFIEAFGPETGPAHYRNDLALRNALNVVSTLLLVVGVVTSGQAYESNEAGKAVGTILWSLAAALVALGLAAAWLKYPRRTPSAE